MTSTEKLAMYSKILKGVPIESRLWEHIIEHMNSEIVGAGTASRQGCIKSAQRTIGAAHTKCKQQACVEHELTTSNVARIDLVCVRVCCCQLAQIHVSAAGCTRLWLPLPVDLFSALICCVSFLPLCVSQLHVHLHAQKSRSLLQAQHDSTSNRQRTHGQMQRHSATTGGRGQQSIRKRRPSACAVDLSPFFPLTCLLCVCLPSLPAHVGASS